MFTLPKQPNKSNSKNHNKSHTINHSQTRKKPNINQIKEEIQFILKRNNSPPSLNLQKQTQKSHKNIHHHLLQRKRSKILQRANQQNIEKAKNNRKIYEEYLMGDLAPKTSSKIIQPKETTHNFHLNQTIFSKELQRDFSYSKNNFNSSRTLELLREQKKSQSMFTDKEIQHLGLGKLLFYKDSSIKLKRASLLQGRESTEQRSLFKDTAMQSFYQEPSLDITRYLKHLEKNTVENQETQAKPEPKLVREPSLEIFRKDLIPKQVFRQQKLSPANPENLSVFGTQKQYAENSQHQGKRLTKFEISPHFKDQSEQMRKTLNVMDEELLVYYGKMKGRRPSKDYLPSMTHRTSVLHKSRPRQSEQKFDRVFDMGNRTSIEIKKPMVKEYSWRFQHFDPWEKHRPEEDMEHENTFEEMVPLEGFGLRKD